MVGSEEKEYCDIEIDITRDMCSENNSNGNLREEWIKATKSDDTLASCRRYADKNSKEFIWDGVILQKYREDELGVANYIQEKDCHCRA